MPGTEELMARLQQLENGYYGDKENMRQKQFFDTYGSRFSNNNGLGLAILNELDARGVDTSAADEAVQQILDQLRTECSEIIESIKEVQQEAIEQAQKVESIGNVVAQATAANPNASGNADIDPMMSMGDMGGLSAMDPEAEFNPEDVPVDAGMPEEEMPVEEEMPEEPPAEELPPDEALSDKRMKNIRSTLSGVRARRSTAGFKPSASIVSAAMGGRQ